MPRTRLDPHTKDPRDPLELMARLLSREQLPRACRGPEHEGRTRLRGHRRAVGYMPDGLKAAALGHGPSRCAT